MPTLRLAPASHEDYRRLAEKRLPRALFDYVDGGAYGERTLRSNVADLEALKLRQQVLRDVSSIDTTARLFGRRLDMPLALAPVGLAGMMARRAETQAKRAADSAGLPFCLSTVGICSIEEVAAVSDIPFWFQLYMLRDRGPVRELLARAALAGVRTLVFTVDLSVVGARYRDIRNGLSGSLGPLKRFRAGPVSYLMHPGWLSDVAIGGRPHSFGNLTEYVPKATTPADFKDWIDSQLDPGVTWSDIEWLRDIWDGDLVIKGVLSPRDARMAVDSGADAVIVSNHGGRQLDGVASSIAMLPRVVEAVDGRAGLLMDGGVRSGQDVVKALALGAQAVLMGRPWVYAVAARGTSGVTDLLATMKGELEVTMALTGATTLAEIGPDTLDHGA
ncbi:MAG: L-lactate dehydrogenase [Alphaproteobacteria bacterium]|nr:L-lactate dehydrogenase [Alphaproteobacteria bacterium]